MSDNQTLLKQLAIAVIGLAKQHYSDDDFAALDIGKLQQTMRLISECVPLPYSSDPKLLHHIADSLIRQYSPEETVMHVFLLYIFRLSSEGSNHPLERGVIRQQVIGLLPIFEAAVSKGLIRTDVYDKNADALAHIAENSGEVPDILEALSLEYHRLAAC